MKQLIVFMTVLVLFACGSANRAKKALGRDDIYVSDQRLEKKYFFSLFKLGVFLQGIQYGFNGSPEVRKLLTEDKSGGALGEAIIDPEDINSAAKLVVQRIKRDSALNLRQMPKDLQGKAVFKFCLDFYNSKELDSIANHLYKIKYSRPNILKANN